MPLTQTTGRQIADGSIERVDLNTTKTGAAVITKVIAGTGVTIANTGVDAGTGDVTISVNSSGATSQSSVVNIVASNATIVNNFASANYNHVISIPGQNAGTINLRANLLVQARPSFMAEQCVTDLYALMNKLLSITTPAQVSIPTIGTTSLAPGVYDFGANAVQLFGTLTLSGTATDYWIFKTKAAFATTATTSVITMGGTATSANVFWVIGNNAPSFGASTVFRGTLINTAAIAAAATMTVDGRLFTTAGAISIGTGTTLYPPIGVCTAVQMGVLSTFVVFTVAGACATTSTITNYGDVGSHNTDPATWTLNGHVGNVYGPTTQAFRATYALYSAGVIIPYSERIIERATSSLMSISLESNTTIASSDTLVECRQQVNVGSTVISNKQFTLTRTT